MFKLYDRAQISFIFFFFFFFFKEKKDAYEVRTAYVSNKQVGKVSFSNLKYSEEFKKKLIVNKKHKEILFQKLTVKIKTCIFRPEKRYLSVYYQQIFI